MGCFFVPLTGIYKVPSTCCVSNMDVFLEPFVSARTGPSTTLQEPQFFFLGFLEPKTETLKRKSPNSKH